LTDNKSANTKPRRRRRKKKKKKKPASEPISSDEESGDFGIPIQKELNTTKKSSGPRNNAPSGVSNMSTPQEVIRRRLIENDGYEASQVEQAMEEMWDKGLSFDEYESVVRYLRSGDGKALYGAATASTASNSVLSVSTNDAEEYMAEISSHSLNESLEGPEEKENLDIDDTSEDIRFAQDDSLQDNCEEKNEEEIEEEAVEEENEKELEEEAPVRKPVTMAMKLDTVALFENLTDAIYALTEWVKKAARKEEFEIFCRAEETSALPMVIRRGISTEIEDTSRFETAVQPALVRLLLAVMNRCGIDELQTTFRGELEEKIEQMLKQARKISLLTPDVDDEDMIARRVSRFVVSRLTIAMDKKIKYDKNQTEVSNALEEEDEAMATLLSQRDDLKANATRAYETVQKSMHLKEQSNGTAKDEDCSSSSTTSSEMDDITLHIVDEETKKRFIEERSRLEELKSQVREQGESGDAVRCLQESAVSLETKRKGYRDEIAKLRAALEELEAKEKDMSLKIESLSTQIVEEEENKETKAKQLEKDLAQVKESVRYANLVSGLAGMMKNYGRSIEKAATLMTGPAIQNNDSDHNSIGNKTDDTETITEASALHVMEDYLSNARDYFLKEADCFNQLKHRLTTKTAEVAALQTELAQYNSVKGLFATATIPTQIKQAIERNKRLVQAYNQTLLTQKDAGRLMYEELLFRLENYRASTTVDSETEDLFPTVLLKGVPAAIRLLKIVDQDCEDLAPFVVQEPEIEEDSTHNSVATESVTTTSEIPPPSPRSVTSVPSSPYVAPKLNWASAKKKQAGSKKPKKSLLDIQKEELTRSLENAY